MPVSPEYRKMLQAKKQQELIPKPPEKNIGKPVGKIAPQGVNPPKTRYGLRGIHCLGGPKHNALRSVSDVGHPWIVQYKSDGTQQKMAAYVSMSDEHGDPFYDDGGYRYYAWTGDPFNDFDASRGLIPKARLTRYIALQVNKQGMTIVDEATNL